MNTQRGFWRSAEVLSLRAEVLSFWKIWRILKNWNRADLICEVVWEPLWGKRSARRGFCRRAEVFALREEVLGGWGLKYLWCSQSADLYPNDSMRQVKTRSRAENWKHFCGKKVFSRLERCFCRSAQVCGFYAEVGLWSIWWMVFSVCLDSWKVERISMGSFRTSVG